MGLILLDTSVLVDNLRGVPEAAAALDGAETIGHRLTASVVTKIELMSGMRAHEKRATRDLLAALAWVPVDDAIAERAGEHARAYRRSHQGIGVVDFIIAATAEHLDAALWTHNVRHYPMFADLAAPY
jgi:predicted nucleic acid-binding protein